MHRKDIATDISRHMSSLTENFYNSVRRHFVTLSCVRRAPGTADEKPFVFSGFLVEAAGFWLYVTAGHILRDIRLAIEQGATFDVWRLSDYTAAKKFNGIGIPFDFDIDKWLVIEDEQRGLDYAAVLLHPLDRLNLEAGGAAPITQNAWGDYINHPDHWALVGIPSDSISYDGITLLSGKVVVAPLQPTAPPELAGARAENQFYARLMEDTAGIVKDVDGMSGGPIFALTKSEGEWKFFVIGVQSAWYEGIRTIAACPFSSFGHSVVEEIESTLREATGNLSRPS